MLYNEQNRELYIFLQIIWKSKLFMAMTVYHTSMMYETPKFISNFLHNHFFAPKKIDIKYFEWWMWSNYTVALGSDIYDEGVFKKNDSKPINVFDSKEPFIGEFREF